MEMYSHNEAAVLALIERKKRVGHVREHPDFPGDAEMLLFYDACL